MDDIKNEMAPVKPTKKEEKGASLVEYALLVALIAVVAIAAITFLGQKVSGKLKTVGDQLS